MTLCCPAGCYAKSRKGNEEEKFIEISNKCNQQQVEVTFPKDADGSSDFMEKSMAVNLMVTLEILKLYHEWLQQ